jgi:hypothetical protein
MTGFGCDFHGLLYLRQGGSGQKQQSRDTGRPHI